MGLMEERKCGEFAVLIDFGKAIYNAILPNRARFCDIKKRFTNLIDVN